MQNLDTTLNWLHLFGDPTRVRLMALLAREELTVAELTTITELSQSRVSTHLGKLKEAGLLRDRPEGASTYYAANDAAMPAAAQKLWALLDGELSDAMLEADRERCEDLLKARDGAAAWPDAIAGQMERHYSPGRTWEATARGIVGLVHLGDVLDIGAGDGAITQLLATRARSITCLDRSEKVIAAAQRRLASLEHVRCQVGDMHELPFDEGSFDQILMFNVLTYAHAPERALSEAKRVLRPRGALAVVTLDRHAHQDVTSAYNHLQPGFAPDELRTLIEAAGLTVQFCGVTSRERRKPHFEVVSAFATEPG